MYVDVFSLLTAIAIMVILTATGCEAGLQAGVGGERLSTGQIIYRRESGLSWAPPFRGDVRQ